ncbi:hypothetical protein E4U54_004812, partial [Claviceps lovelessii]
VGLPTLQCLWRSRQAASRLLRPLGYHHTFHVRRDVHDGRVWWRRTRTPCATVWRNKTSCLSWWSHCPH